MTELQKIVAWMEESAEINANDDAIEHAEDVLVHPDATPEMIKRAKQVVRISSRNIIASESDWDY